MNDQAQNDQPTGDQSLTGASPPPDGQQSGAAPPAPRFKLTWHFAAGFLGWYLVMGLLFISQSPGVNPNSPSYGEGLLICSGIIFPVQLIGLILLFAIKGARNLGWGMLSALGVNFVISLVLGLNTNALCFIPFFSPLE